MRLKHLALNRVRRRSLNWLLLLFDTSALLTLCGDWPMSHSRWWMPGSLPLRSKMGATLLHKDHAFRTAADPAREWLSGTPGRRRPNHFFGVQIMRLCG